MNRIGLRWRILVAWLFLSPAALLAQSKPESIVQNSSSVLREIMEVPMQGIPKSMLADAEGIAVIPNVIKGGFVIGARFGSGVLLVRAEDGSWHAPVFINLTGGNIGWQAGVQATDVVLVFKTKKSVEGILQGKFTIGADAAAAAGPVGRQAAAATDGRLQAEIYSYSRSRGLFLGVSFDGSMIQVDQLNNASYYQVTSPGQPAAIPPSAVALVNQVTAISTGVENPTATNPTGFPQAPLAQQHSVDEVKAVQQQLASLAPKMYELLDPTWQQYLGLPAEVFNPQAEPSLESMEQCLARFEAVRNDARYTQLATRPEFQSTYGLLRHYVGARRMADDVMQLPPPP